MAHWGQHLLCPLPVSCICIQALDCEVHGSREAVSTLSPWWTCHRRGPNVINPGGNADALRCPCAQHPLTLGDKVKWSGDSDGKESTCNVGDLGSIPGLGRSSGERNSYLLQYSVLEKYTDSGAWWATVHGVTNLNMPISWGWRDALKLIRMGLPAELLPSDYFMRLLSPAATGLIKIGGNKRNHEGN